MATINESMQTLEQFLSLPETEPASEYIEGTVVQKPMPKGKHSELQRCLSDRLNTLRPIIYALPELRCTFAGRSLVPDVAAFRKERIPLDPSGEVANDFLLAPDLAVEIASPDQDINELVEKLGFCLHHGAELGWLIDPDRKQVVAFRRDELPQQLPPNGSLEDSSLLPGFRLTLTELFGWLKLSGE